MKRLIVKKILLFGFFLFCTGRALSQTIILPYQSTWKYLDNGTNQGTAWRAVAFADATWASGPAELGYGDADEATVVSYGASSTTKYITTYFRKSINIADPTAFTNFTLNLVYDDGAVVYVNGVEVARARMTGVVSYTTLADSPGIEETTTGFTVASSAFVAGNNVIAVEMHQQAASSTDISFDLQLIGNDAFSATLTRGPYLQMGNETAITIRWRTSVAQNSRIELGTVYGTYPTVVTDAASVTEHIVRVTGLTTDTKYYYRIGNSTNMSSPDVAKFFTTAPAANTTRKIRIAAFGDCGRGNTAYQDENLTNYINYLSTNGIDAPDAWILLGDNAYSTGSDAEYTTNFFGIYGNTLLKNHKLYPAPGNHDYANNTANKSSRAMPYYSNFTTPQAGECGGVASNKPNFYSFNIGNIHFLSLDAWGIESDASYMGKAGTTMLKTWLDADLAANTKKWIIAYWHHPPYTKSSHDSDAEAELVAIRQNFANYLEAKGVDLIINGHAHAYERGYLLRNFTGSWTSFTPATHAVSTSSATYTSAATCPYRYNSTPLNHGTVYVVAGSTGASGGTFTGFGANAFPFAVNDGGVLFFEVEDNRLDAKMLRRNGTIFDRFTIMKDVAKTTNTSIVSGQSVTLTASWPSLSAYSWSTAQSTRSITVSPATGVNNYTVTDNFGCITDQFQVTVLPTLPVLLSKYDVVLEKGKAYIKWTTATESDTKTFIVERSADGVNFTKLGVVNANGNSTTSKAYQLVDPQPLKGISYYRLSQQDVDGSMKFFEVKKIVNKDGKSFDLKTSSQGNGLNILVTSTQKIKATIRIYDMNGRLVMQDEWNVSAGINEKRLSLGNGSYLLQFINDLGEGLSRKVLIQ